MPILRRSNKLRSEFLVDFGVDPQTGETVEMKSSPIRQVSALISERNGGGLLMGLAIAMILLEAVWIVIERELSNTGLLIIFFVLGIVGTVMCLRARRRLRLIERDRDDNAGAP